MLNINFVCLCHFSGDPKKFKCEHCDSTYKSLDALKQHLRKHNTKIEECKICKRKVKYMKKHQAVNAICQQKLRESKRNETEMDSTGKVKVGGV